MFTKNIFKDKDTVADLVGNILEADYKVKKEELKGNQHKIDMNKNNKIDAHDFKLLRSKGTQKEEVELDEVESVAEGSDHDNDYHYTDEKGNKYRYGASGYVGVVNKNGINQGQQHISSLSDVHKKNYEKLYGKKTKNEGVEEAYQKNFNPHDDLASRGIGRISMNKTPAGKKKEFDRGTELLKHQMKTTKATGGVSGPKGKLPEEVESVAEGSTQDAHKMALEKLQKALKNPNIPAEKKAEIAKQIEYQRSRLQQGVAEAAKWRNNPNAYDKDEEGDIRPKGTKFTTDPLAYREKHADDAKTTRGKKQNLKYSLQYAKGKHGPVGKLPEEVEQIDELNKDTLYSYNKKAGADVEKKDKSLGQLIRKGDSTGANKTARQLNNRLAGQERAEKRLNKEEVEQVDERTLTPGETSEKERIVKGMKKSLSGFKQRYGDRAKSVMYATATARAKK